MGNGGVPGGTGKVADLWRSTWDGVSWSNATSSIVPWSERRCGYLLQLSHEHTALDAHIHRLAGRERNEQFRCVRGGRQRAE